MPTVSIILPTWNRSKFLGHAIKSILKQTYTDFELLVVDDGSTDDTPLVMQNLIQSLNDPRIRYIRLEQHRGGAQARNVAIREAHGKFIASQDDDDEWAPQYLEKQVQNLSSLPDEYGMSYVNYKRVLPGGKQVLMPPKKFQPKSGNIYGGDIMKKNYCPFQAGIIRKKVLEDVGLVDEEMNSLYDWEMWLRISKKYKIGHVDEILFTWNYTPNSNSGDPKKIWWRIDGRKIILRKYGEDIRKFGYFADHMSRLADLLIEAGDLKQARRSLRAGIKNSPFVFILWLKLFVSYLGQNYLALQKKEEEKYKKRP